MTDDSTLPYSAQAIYASGVRDGRKDYRRVLEEIWEALPPHTMLSPQWNRVAIIVGEALEYGKCPEAD